MTVHIELCLCSEKMLSLSSIWALHHWLNVSGGQSSSWLCNCSTHETVISVNLVFSSGEGLFEGGGYFVHQSVSLMKNDMRTHWEGQHRNECWSLPGAVAYITAVSTGTERYWETQDSLLVSAAESTSTPSSRPSPRQACRDSSNTKSSGTQILKRSHRSLTSTWTKHNIGEDL